MDDGEEAEGLVLEGFRWCRSARATVSWGRDFDDPACSVEVRAPDVPFEVLRGWGSTFVEAYHSCREKHEQRRRAPCATLRSRVH